MPGPMSSFYGVETGAVKYDLVVNLWDSGQGIEGAMQYNSELFNHETITHLAHHFEGLLGNIAACPNSRLNDLKTLSEAEELLFN
jgi:hypothetical protein